MKKYTVLTWDVHNQFEALVEKYLKNGWQLQGGVSTIINRHGSVEYFQAVTKGLNNGEH